MECLTAESVLTELMNRTIIAPKLSVMVTGTATWEISVQWTTGKAGSNAVAFEVTPK